MGVRHAGIVKEPCGAREARLAGALRCAAGSELEVTDEINLDERGAAKPRYAHRGTCRDTPTILREMACIDSFEGGKVAVEIAQVNPHEDGILVTVSRVRQDSGQVCETESRLSFDVFRKRSGKRVGVRWKLARDIQPAIGLDRVRVKRRRVGACVGDDGVDLVFGP